MKTEREILSLGPCRCLFYRKLYKKEQKIQNTSYLNVKKKKKIIGRVKVNYLWKKSFELGTGLVVAWPVNIVIFL